MGRAPIDPTETTCEPESEPGPDTAPVDASAGRAVRGAGGQLGSGPVDQLSVARSESWLDAPTEVWAGTSLASSTGARSAA
jgi:hypothetical protein